MQDDDGQTMASHSISAGLDYPGVGPEHAWLRDSGRVHYEGVTDAEAMAAFELCCRTEGIIPAIESAHAVAGAQRLAKQLGPEASIVINMSGRGDKDVATAAAYFGLGTCEPASGGLRRRPPRTGHCSSGTCRRASPTWVDAVAIVSAMVENGVDVVEIGLPYSDPLMDGPVIQAAADQALANGINTTDVLRTVRALADMGAPTLIMSYWNPIEHFGVDRFAMDLAQAGGVGVITPDIIPEEAQDWIRATDEAMIDRVFLVALSSPRARIERSPKSAPDLFTPPRPWVSLAPAPVSEPMPPIWSPGPRGDPPAGVSALGFPPRSRPQRWPRYADGVIVGSAFVRLVLEAKTPAAAVADVAALAAGWPLQSARHASKEPKMSDRLKDVIGLVSRLGLAFVWGYAGIVKIFEVNGARDAILAYRIFLPNGWPAGLGTARIRDPAGDSAAAGIVHPAGGAGFRAADDGVHRRHRQCLDTRLPIDCGCFGGGGDISAEGIDAKYARDIARDFLLWACRHGWWSAALCGRWIASR